MRVLVYGAGAVGSTLGGYLSEDGHEVVLLSRPEHARAINTRGLHIDGILGEHHCTPRAAAALSELGDWRPELTLVTVKSFDTRAAARALAEFTRGDGKFIHFQNGIGNYEILRDYLPEENLFSAMIIIGFKTPEPGRATVTVYGGDVRLGRYRGPADEPSRELARLFARSPIAFHASADIESHLWGKLLYNACLNPLGAILGVPYGRLVEPGLLGIMEAVVVEVFAVARAAGARLFWETPREYVEHLKANLIPPTAEHRPSMLADLEAGRPTEIDFINGAISRLGAEHGVPTPVNDTLVGQVKFMESRGAGGR